MTFNKKISSGLSAPDNRSKDVFPKGLNYFMKDGSAWTVTEELFSDNTEMRRVVCASTGSDEILTLVTLKRDLGDGIIQFLPDEPSKVEETKPEENKSMD